MNKIINDEYRHEIGVYKLFHTDLPNEIYIGGTRVIARKGNCGFYKRLCGHIKSLRSEKHHSKRLQEIVDSNGIDGLVMEIIEVVSKPEDVIKREQYYMDLLHPALNTVKYAGTSLGYRHTREVREYFSRTRKGAKHPPISERTRAKMSTHAKTRDLSYLRSEVVLKKKSDIMKGRKQHEKLYQSIIRRIHQYTKDGQFIQTFPSITLAAQTVNIDRSMISKTAAGVKKSAAGYIWKYD
jgi:group I intron endonuclease